jgi:hypothetical protein
MARADAGAVVTVEILMKGDEVSPVGISLKLLRAAEDRPPSVFVAQKDARESL